MAGRIICAVTYWLCALYFGGFGFYFRYIRKKPAWFWAGTEVKESEITDIPAYNRANGLLWLAYAALWVALGAAMIVNVRLGLVLTLLSVVPGLPLLIFFHTRIYNKYNRGALK